MTAAGENPYLPPEATGSAPGRGRLAGRRVLVVGAGTRPSPEPDPPIGNGRAIAVLAAREGASVVCADRDEAAAEVTAGLVRAEGSRAAVVLADVADPKACEAVVAESVEALGGLDGLVLNVGFALGRGITGTTAEQWEDRKSTRLNSSHGSISYAVLCLIDKNVTHSSRIWSYWLGGKDNYPADRQAGDEYLNIFF